MVDKDYALLGYGISIGVGASLAQFILSRRLQDQKEVPPNALILPGVVAIAGVSIASILADAEIKKRTVTG